MPTTLINDAGWAGLALLSLVFLANAVGLIDQSTAVREMVAAGPPRAMAGPAVAAGRVLQLAAAPALFFAATALVAFLVPATLVAHAFWKAAPEARGEQLAGFLKNAAIVGGLVLAAGWRSAA